MHTITLNPLHYLFMARWVSKNLFVCAGNGIAAVNLPNGRTTHLTFGIPLEIKTMLQKYQRIPKRINISKKIL